MNPSSDENMKVGGKGTWRTFDGTNGLPGPALALLQDRNGYLWIGTWGQGLCRYDGEVFRPLTSEDGMVGDTVWGICEDGHGLLWIATEDGVSRYDGADFVNFTVENGLVHNEANALLQDRQGRMWFATSGGVSCLEGVVGRADLQGLRFTNYTSADGLLDDCTYALAEDGDGHLWFELLRWGDIHQLYHRRRPGAQSHHRPLSRQCR